MREELPSLDPIRLAHSKTPPLKTRTRPNSTRNEKTYSILICGQLARRWRKPYGEHMQTPVSVVKLGERKLLGALFAVGTWASNSFVIGKLTLPAYREHLRDHVISAEQGKPVSLPARGRSTVRRIDDRAGIGIARKRTLPCNRADRGCVASMGQHDLAGNGADFAMVFQLEIICGTDTGSKANDDRASGWCSFPHAGVFFSHCRASWPQISIE